MIKVPACFVVKRNCSKLLPLRLSAFDPPFIFPLPRERGKG